MFFRRQRSEGIEGLDRIRESLRQQQQERRDRGEVDDLLVTDPTELDEGVAVIKPVREATPDVAEPDTAETTAIPAEIAASVEPEVIEPTPFVEAPAPETPPEPVYAAPPAVAEPVAAEAAPVAQAPVEAPPPPPVREAAPPPPPVVAAPVAAAPSAESAVDRLRRTEPYRPSGTGESLIARNASWDGQLFSEGDVRVEGALQGSIEAQGTLFIAQDARVNAKVRARNIIIAGEFDGEITCDEKLEVLPSGSIAGEVNANTLVIHEGAFVDSRFAMNMDSVAARNAR